MPSNHIQIVVHKNSGISKMSIDGEDAYEISHWAVVNTPGFSTVDYTDVTDGERAYVETTHLTILVI